MDEYKKWSREVDQKSTPFQPKMLRYEVFEAKGYIKGSINGPRQEVPFQIIEDFDVESYADWERVVPGDSMRKHVADWRSLADESSLVIIYADKIE